MGAGGDSPQKPGTFQKFSKNQIKSKPDLYFLKRRLHIFFLLKAYVVRLERKYIDIWGSGGESPQKPATSQRIR